MSGSEKVARKVAAIPFVVPLAEEVRTSFLEDMPQYQRDLVSTGKYTVNEMFAYLSFYLSAQNLLQLDTFMAFYREVIAPEIEEENAPKSRIVIPGGAGKLIVPN